MYCLDCANWDIQSWKQGITLWRMVKSKHYLVKKVGNHCPTGSRPREGRKMPQRRSGRNIVMLSMHWFQWHLTFNNVAGALYTVNAVHWNPSYYRSVKWIEKGMRSVVGGTSAATPDRWRYLRRWDYLESRQWQPRGHKRYRLCTLSLMLTHATRFLWAVAVSRWGRGRGEQPPKSWLSLEI